MDDLALVREVERPAKLRNDVERFGQWNRLVFLDNGREVGSLEIFHDNVGLFLAVAIP